MMRVLIVDDEEALRRTLAKFLALEGWEVREASNGLSARRILEDEPFDAVALDLRMPGSDGLEVLEWVTTQGPAVPVVMMSAFGDVGDAVAAMKRGAADYLVKPFDPDELRIRLEKAREEQRWTRPRPQDRRGDEPVLSRDAAMAPVVDLLDRAAPSDATVLITGESGTGKEVAARYLHRRSDRSDGPFVAVNLGGLPEGLVESELFGYEKGAFTGADARKIGFFEAASGGTLFLDEVGELPGALQVKLLRALQDRKIQRLGGLGVIPVDVRIVAATNRDLEAAVARGEFREDLYYRINVIRAELPPLRDRPADVPFLARLFLDRLRERGRTEIDEIAPSAMDALAAYTFPGNVRELENMVERAVILADGPVLRAGDFGLEGAAGTGRPPTSGRPAGTLRDMEIRMIREALLRNENHRERSAGELGISRKTLHNKMKEYGIAPE